MILVDRDIRNARVAGDIVIEPWDDVCLGTNSYDVHLADTLVVHVPWDDEGYRTVLDVRTPPRTRTHKIPHDGFVLQPNVLYLASTVEYTETHRHVPVVNGKSSLGRLGLSIHVTAGFGDVGFRGHWTLELFVIEPLRIYAGMKIAQLVYHEPSGQPDVPYDRKPGAKYVNRDSIPQQSLSHLNFKGR